MAHRNSHHHSDRFLMLGHNHGIYYYLPVGSGQIVELKPEQHVEGRLIELAPRSWWEQSEYGEEGKGISWKAAQSSLIHRQQHIRIYDPERVRGLGAWWDNDKAILHLGDKLISGDQELPLSTPGKYIYEAAKPFNINHKNPLDAEDARKLIKICELVSWEKPISAKYLAGWLALAPVCGALAWRPHIWMVGASGAGKSWCFNHIIKRIIGPVSQAVQHDTTEAGLRQKLRHDAKPIIFDEAEGKDLKAQGRIDNVIRLARASSTEGEVEIIKGGSDGESMSYRIRSCFMFSSIGYGVTEKPDENRISALSVRKDDNADKFELIKKMVADTLTDEYVNRFLARSIRMIPTIRANARVFSAAGAAEFKDQRAGDQIGALLAGAYSLYSDKPITPEQATEYISKQDWADQKQSNSDTDEMQLINHIKQHMLRVEPRLGTASTRPIGELFLIAATITDQDSISAADANDTLSRNGIKLDGLRIVIASKHTSVANILKGTQWARNWASTLRRIPGSETIQSARFKFGVCCAVKLPAEILDSKPSIPASTTESDEYNASIQDGNQPESTEELY